jgi:hypothetical protein
MPARSVPFSNRIFEAMSRLAPQAAVNSDCADAQSFMAAVPGPGSLLHFDDGAAVGGEGYGYLF